MWGLSYARGMSTGSILTMAGFEWSATEAYVSHDGGDGWCLRDAICQLFGWEPSSEEYSRFIEAPTGPDTTRLAEYLGLTAFNIDNPEDWNQLIQRYAHPGLAVFVFPEYDRSHTIYVPDVQWLLHHWPKNDGAPAEPEDHPLWSYGWPLGAEYMERGPELAAVFVDERQAPHAA